MTTVRRLALEDLSDGHIDDVQRRLLAWWHTNQRDLPWRETRDPYRILVSEVMLQQTQVDRVIPYFERWLSTFPSVEALADAATAEVIRLWAGLGYNRRAVNLQRTAQAVVERGGEFPTDVRELQGLPGVGPYTAGAIACFAFEQDVQFIDTNMRRVLHRLFFGVDVPTLRATDREISHVAARLVPPGDGWNWNQALIEFGALLCTARKPCCIVCPLQTRCAAFPEIQTAIALLPKGSPRKKEAPFRESNRFFRGRVVNTLREHPGNGIALENLGPIVRPGFSEADVPWLFEVVRGLERDGLARIAEEEPGYDTLADADLGNLARVRIRLP